MSHAVAKIPSAALVALLVLLPHGAVGQCCGDCSGDGVVTVDEVVTSVKRALAGCSDDGICSTESCPAQLAQCRSDLAAAQSFPASGQITTYGAGSDGDVQAGAILSYTDNGDGTITDNNTGLMWEKKDDSGGIHDVNPTYTWGMYSAPHTMNGTMVTAFLAALNSAEGFAGHTDWRIPNLRELQSIVDYQIPYPGPTLGAPFHHAATCGGCVEVTATTCSCTAPAYYWASTTFRGDPNYAWSVNFELGLVTPANKSLALSVRAVRGGM